jgi:hypothetical protein
MPGKAFDDIIVDLIKLDVIAAKPARKVARRILVTGDRQRSVPMSLQFGDEGIDQRLERSRAHQTPGIRETFVCHHHPPIGAPNGLREGL